jgi:ADP-heptose:LPS heptosyltransferase
VRIRVVREAGGLGDMLRMFPVVDGLKRKFPGCELHFYGLADYRDLMLRSPSIDRYIECPRDRRRPRDAPLDETRFPYLKKGITYDLQFDMYCPAWRHEATTRGSVTTDRVELFCRAAGLDPQPLAYPLREEEKLAGATWVASLGIPADRVIALQPFATHVLRCWATERWAELVRLLTGAGFCAVVFDVVPGRARAVGGRPEVRNNFAALALKLAACNYLIGVDSGLLHLAAAVGIPSLLIAGCTSGPILCRPYPLATWITGPVCASAPQNCQTPCYAFGERGCAQQCRQRGCAVAQNVSAQQVFDAFRAVYEPKERG